jgi:hypothetical protein
VFEDRGSTRIDLACPHCRRLFKVRLRKLQFGADLVCRLCRHEFSARDVTDRAEVKDALARMHRIVEQRTPLAGPSQPRDRAGSSPTQASEVDRHRHDDHRLPTMQQEDGQGSCDI